MSLFRYSDYHNSTKNQSKYMKKTKLPTEFKTKPHNCSQCPRKDTKKYYLTEDEVRWLCPVCILKNNNRDKIEKPHFIRASKLGT